MGRLAGLLVLCFVVLLRLVSVVASVLLLRAEAGVCARRRSNFLLAAKRKSPKRRRPPVCVPHSPCRANGGSLRCSDLGWCRRTRCVLRTPLKQLRQARVRSVCVLRHTRPPQLLRFSAQPAGVGSGYHPAAAAQLRLGSGRAVRCRRGDASALASRAQRRTTGRAKQWPEWSPLPPPSDRVEKRRAWGERVPKDTRIVVWLAAAV